MKLTIKEFADKTQTEYHIAAATLAFFKQKGQVTVAGKISKGKGKPTLIYEVPQTLLIEIT